MRRYSEDYARVNNVIQADKSVMSEACKSLVLQGICEKLEEYFDVVGLPRMELTCKNGTYDVTLSFSAERIKKFNVLK